MPDIAQPRPEFGPLFSDADGPYSDRKRRYRYALDQGDYHTTEQLWKEAHADQRLAQELVNVAKQRMRETLARKN